MQVTFHLRRRPGPEPATALLVPSHQPADVLRVCADLGGASWPPLFPVADGFLVLLPRPTERAPAGVIRLRGLAPHLLLPADADLVPTLREDEAAALVRQRGLVFLPGGRVLEFQPQQPLPLSALLTAPLRRGPWQPLPERPQLAERLTEITLDLPEVPPEEILEAGGEEVGVEEPRPPAAGRPARLLGKAAFWLGQGLAGLGQVLRWPGLARAGARWAAGGLSLSPRLSEVVLGRREAALHTLLRDFRAGRVERALRRALPLGSERLRGARPTTSARLPTRNTRFSLRSLLGERQGPAGLWLEPADLFRELEREYRTQAERAARAGDYRRAAFIYGKLLEDYRAAAATLARGGLHHHAAILFLKKVGDTGAAAREYEAAGDFDRALELYRRRGEHELAGDLLRRAGAEDRAVREYQAAAVKLAASGAGDYLAGELLLNRAGRPDLALAYYQAGWSRRLQEKSVGCAVRLAQLHARAGAADRFLELVTEADAFFDPPGHDGPAAEFYNEVARVADQPGLEPAHDDLRDRALLGLAHKLRQRVREETRAGFLVSRLLGQSPVWAPAVVSDAQHAVQRALPRPAPPQPARSALATVLVRGGSVVTAVCQATDTGDLFLGFRSGEVFCYRPQRGEVVPLPGFPHKNCPVLSLAARGDGDLVVGLLEDRPAGAFLAGFSRFESWFQRVGTHAVRGTSRPWLCPLITGDGDSLVTLFDGADLVFFQGRYLISLGRSPLASPDLDLKAVLLYPTGNANPPRLVLLAFGDTEGCSAYSSSLNLQTDRWLHWGTSVGWSPCHPENSSLSSPVLAWLKKPDGLEVAGITQGGNLAWSDLPGPDFRSQGHHAFHGPGPYQAVALLRPGSMAAVTRGAVHWLRRAGNRFQLQAETRIPALQICACFAHHPSQELIAVGAEGTLVRVALPADGPEF